MREVDKQFSSSIAEIYDSHLVPLIFEPYADDIARRVSALAPASILEIAAGSGVATRAVAGILQPDVRFVVTDLNAPMLDHAESMQPDDHRIEWRAADAQNLAFGDNSFDLVFCQFGAMFFPDRVAAYREAHRVLRRGGSFVFSMWDRIEENEFADVVTQAAAHAFSHDPPRFLARTPHGHSDPEIYRSDLKAAGFGDVTVTAGEEVSVAANPSIPAIAYCQGTPLRTEIEDRHGPDLAEMTERAAVAVADRFGDGEVRGRIRAFIVAAR